MSFPKTVNCVFHLEVKICDLHTLPAEATVWLALELGSPVSTLIGHNEQRLAARTSFSSSAYSI